ncbi:MAG TPA: HI0074 family nucleotidyltransferase substrate-binding subunit [Candidatus Kapabacteria bacterium]|nr:HI0074 family nucleotidyltransferase substrate-binding subunit [Candidatus Kapabacteria bacterium]
MEIIIKEFKNAVQGFAYLVNLDWKSLQGTMDNRMVDGLENGMVQKFEYTIELCWKLIKKFLLKEDGIDAKTPKHSVKEFYNIGYIDEEAYLNLIEMINDRNKLSHIYDGTEFRKILNRFPCYLKIFEKVAVVVERSLI